jgi:hypothetical protein
MQFLTPSDLPLSQVRIVDLPQLVQSFPRHGYLNAAYKVITVQKLHGPVQTGIASAYRRKLQRFKPFPLP